MAVLLGCIADDFTGATDLAGMLVKHGMRTVQMIGVPPAAPPAGTDAIVVALKTRTAPPEEAIASSLAALEWLRGAGCRQILFKYCSTFDSTDRGNIGPVAEALMDAWEPISRLPARPSRPTDAPYSAAICSSAMCCCTRAACRTIRSRR